MFQRIAPSALKAQSRRLFAQFQAAFGSGGDKHHEAKHQSHGKEHNDHGHGHGHAELPPYPETLERTVEARAQLQKEFQHLFPQKLNTTQPRALYNFTSTLRSKTFLDFIAQNFQLNKLDDTHEFTIPPKIHDNSVFLYQSNKLANIARKGRAVEILAAGAIVFGMQYPLLAVPIFGFSYYVWGNAWFYEMTRRLVTRMDLLPHLEMISVQKSGIFGLVYNKLIRISDLEYVDFENLEKKENLFWQHQAHQLDTQLIFRDKTTGEFLCFDRKGFWNEEGLNHPLLN